MSRHIVDAVYENGAFRPIDATALKIKEGARVQIILDDLVQAIPNMSVLDLAAQVYGGLSTDGINEIECIATDRSQFFTS